MTMATVSGTFATGGSGAAAVSVGLLPGMIDSTMTSPLPRAAVPTRCAAA